MALAQPTGLQAQALTPLVSVEQSVERDVAGGPLVELTQMVNDTATIVTGGTLFALEQTVRNLSTAAGGVLITLAQDVERHASARTLVTLRQSVLSAAQALEQPMRVYLDSADITDRCGREITITASEGANRTASVVYRPPSGPLNIPSFQGRSLEISRIDGTTVTPLFTGTVDVPVYNRQARTLTLSSSDLRGERVGRADKATIKQMTGGLYSTITQREDAEGEQYVRELMKTVAGSLDYTSAGVLRYSPWVVGSPRYSLAASDLHHREVRLEFATRSEVVNRISARLEYRYFQRNTISHAVSINVVEASWCKLAGCLPAPTVTVDGVTVDQRLPSKQALRQAAESVSGWHIKSLDYRELPPDGWYRNTSDVTRKRLWGASELVRDQRAMGADYVLERYISQPKRETYALTVEAPQSIDQFGAIDGSSMRFSAETRIDGNIFEERGCVIVADPDDRRADVELAMQAIQRMAKKTILEGHRKNQASFRYKPDGKSHLPVEIGDTISVSSDEVTVTGTVSDFVHTATDDDDRYTDVTLAVYQVDSAQSITEDWTLPAEPTQYRLNDDSQALPATPDCPVPEDEVASASGVSELQPDGTVILVTPSIDRSQVDEIIGTRATTYNVAIPSNTFTVEVP